MLRQLALATTTLALASTALFADPFDAKAVPSDAKWVLHVDVDALVASRFWPAIEQRIDANAGVRQKLTDVETFTGMYLPQDLHSVTLIGMGYEEADGVILINGKANQGQLLAAVQMNPAFTSTPRGTHEILSWEDKGKTMYGSFFSPTRIIMGQSKENIAQALDTLDGTAPAVKPDSVLAQLAPKNAIAGVAGIDVNLLQKKDPNNPVFKNVQNGWIVLTQQADTVCLKALFDIGNDKKALQIKAMAEGAKALGLMAASQENADPKVKAIAPLLGGATISSTGTTVLVDWSAPFDQVKQTAEAFEALRSQPHRPAAKAPNNP